MTSLIRYAARDLHLYRLSDADLQAEYARYTVTPLMTSDYLGLPLITSDESEICALHGYSTDEL